MDQYYVQVQYAKTGKASCRGCKEKISKGQVRIAISYVQDHYQSHPYNHLSCFYLTPRWRELAVEDIKGFAELDSEHRLLVRERIDGLKSGSIKKGVKKRASAKGKGKSVAHNQQQTTKEQVQDSRSETSKKKKKIKKQKKQQAKQMQSAQTAYSLEEIQKLQQIKKKLQKRTCEHLRFLLTLNKQIKTGAKKELLERVADGMLLGAIPHCPNCGGGRPKFEPERNMYRCNGYRDDDHFLACNTRFQRDEIKREPWIDEQD